MLYSDRNEIHVSNLSHCMHAYYRTNGFLAVDSIRRAERSYQQYFSIAVIQSSCWRLLRTTNGVECLHREVRRRASVVSISPNLAACLRLVSAILAEISEE